MNLIRDSAFTENKLIQFSHYLDNTDFTWRNLHWLLIVMYIKEVHLPTASPTSPCHTHISAQQFPLTNVTLHVIIDAPDLGADN